jgi:hypothetical protein
MKPVKKEGGRKEGKGRKGGRKGKTEMGEPHQLDKELLPKACS